VPSGYLQHPTSPEGEQAVPGLPPWSEQDCCSGGSEEESTRVCVHIVTVPEPWVHENETVVGPPESTTTPGSPSCPSLASLHLLVAQVTRPESGSPPPLVELELQADITIPSATKDDSRFIPHQTPRGPRGSRARAPSGLIGRIRPRTVRYIAPSAAPAVQLDMFRGMPRASVEGQPVPRPSAALPLATSATGTGPP
jgi:hypothetical protein